LLLGLNTYSQQQHQESTNEFIVESLNQVATDNCSLIFTITEYDKIFFLKERLKEEQVYNLIQNLYTKCKRKSKVHINHTPNSYKYFDELSSLIREPIMDLQKKLSIERYNKPFSELKKSEWRKIEKTYPTNITGESCCTQE
jgi:hypothetical protein